LSDSFVLNLFGEAIGTASTCGCFCGQPHGFFVAGSEGFLSLLLTFDLRAVVLAFVGAEVEKWWLAFGELAIEKSEVEGCKAAR